MRVWNGRKETSDPRTRRRQPVPFTEGNNVQCHCQRNWNYSNVEITTIEKHLLISITKKVLISGS
jgi:hypothetical protein